MSAMLVGLSTAFNCIDSKECLRIFKENFDNKED